MKRTLVRKSLASALRENPWLTLALAVAVVAVALASLVPPLLLKRVIDENLARKTADGLVALAVLYLASIVASGLFDFAKEAILIVLGQRITRDIRVGMMEKASRLPSAYFSRLDSGQLVSRFTNDVDAIGAMFSGGIVGMAVDCLKIVGIVASVFLFNARLGLITLALIPVFALVTRFFQSRMLSAQVKNRAQTASLSGYLSESVKNARMVKVFNKERFMEERYREMLDENYRTVGKINFYESVFPPVIQILRALVISLVVILSTKDVRLVGITVGMIAASIELVSNLFAPVESVGMEFQGIQGALSGMARVNAFYDEAEDGAKDGTLTAAKILPSREAAEIRFNGLSFAYEGGDDVLSGIDLRVRPLEKVTFTGRTGVGKTTLFQLVMGLLKPREGSITVNGVDVFTIPNGEKKRLFGYVDQNFFLVRGTVADQITLGDESVARADVERAIDAVGLAPYVAGLERGLDTTVSGDALFSQGQRQLLSIARAIVTDPPILLLDEMTANLDSITEGKIVSVLQREGSARTILAISHRPSSMIASDTVVILERGRVRDSGTPDELLSRDEWYRGFVGLDRRVWASDDADANGPDDADGDTSPRADSPIGAT